jgi:glycosyltransferase involved in cell wall biosynthesis
MKVAFMIPTRVGEFSHKVPKGAVGYYTVKEAVRRGYINKIICYGKGRDVSINSSLIKNPFFHWRVGWGIGNFGRYILKLQFDFGREIFDIIGSYHLNRDIDIFHSYPFTNRSIEKAKKLGIITCVQTETAHPKHFNNFFSVPRRILSKLLSSYNNADYLFSISEFAKETFLKEGFSEDKIIDISFGVDVKRFKPGEKKDSVFRGLSVGAMYPYKGIKYLLKAWSELNLENSELILCGIIPDDDMRDLIDSYRGRINIKTPGNVDPRKYYQNASIFIMPSLVEGVNKAVLEALACGLPVIITNNGGEVVRDGIEGFVIKPKDVDSLKEKIEYFYSNPDEIRRIGKNARKRIISNFTWEHYSKRVADAYEHIYEESKFK